MFTTCDLTEEVAANNTANAGSTILETIMVILSTPRTFECRASVEQRKGKCGSRVHTVQVAVSIHCNTSLQQGWSPRCAWQEVGLDIVSNWAWAVWTLCQARCHVAMASAQRQKEHDMGTSTGDGSANGLTCPFTLPAQNSHTAAL
jgi:hypothetical protein